MTGEIQEKDFSDKLNLQQRKDLKEFRCFLMERTDVTRTDPAPTPPAISNDVKTVDIGIPVPFLKVITHAVYANFQNIIHVSVHFRPLTHKAH